ncbi:MAG: hypothetical protein ABJD68_02765 [Nakamurella sp.]
MDWADSAAAASGVEGAGPTTEVRLPAGPGAAGTPPVEPRPSGRPAGFPAGKGSAGSDVD